MLGVVKKIGFMKLIHERFRGAKNEDKKLEFREQFAEAIRYNKDLDNFLNKAQDDLNPLRVLSIFERITPDVCPAPSRD